MSYFTPGSYKSFITQKCQTRAKNIIKERKSNEATKSKRVKKTESEDAKECFEICCFEPNSKINGANVSNVMLALMQLDW